LQIKILWAILRISTGGVAQMLIATASWVFLMRIVSEFGGAAVAGYTIAVRIMLFIILPAFGLSNATATLVGQNLGAGLPLRAEATVWKVMQYVSYYMLATTAIALLFDDQLIGLFSKEPEVMAYGIACLRVFSYGLVFFGISGTAVQAFNGAGDTLTPTWINFFSFWVVQVPLAYVLALVMGIGPEGVFWAVFVSDVIAAVLSVYIFRRSSWKRKIV